MAKAAGVAIYARFSSDKQSDASIEDQVRRARAWLEKAGHDFANVQVFTDFAMSGASMDRPGVAALVKAIADGVVSLVVAESLDRISRDVGDAAHFRRTLAHRDCELYCLDGTRIAAGDKSAALMYGVRSLFAEQYLADLSDKTLRGLEGRARAGAPTGAVAFGFRITTAANGHKAIEIHPEQAAVVRRIFQMYSEGASFGGIAEALNAEGLAPPRAHSRRVGKGWMGSAIREMLLNERYIGRWVFGRRQWVKEPGTNRRVPRERKAGPLDDQERPELALVEVAVWDRVQNRFHDRVSPKRHRRFMLSGLLYCPCGARMTCIGGADRRYGCGASYKRGRSICPNRLTVPIHAMEATVMTALQARLGLRISEVREIVAEEVEALRESLPDRSKELRAQVRELDSQVSNLLDSLGRKSSPAVEQRLAKVETRRETVRAELDAIEVGSRVPKLPSPGLILERVAALLTSIADASPLESRERLRTALLNERIDCVRVGRNYRLSWAIQPDALFNMWSMRRGDSAPATKSRTAQPPSRKRRGVGRFPVVPHGRR